MRGHVQAGCLAVCGVISVACGQGRQTDARAPAFVVSPGSISLSPGSWVQFTATIAVTWSIREGDAGGTIDSSGGYTAPALEGLFHLVATGAEEPHESGGSARFTATVTGSPDHDVVWSADAGTIDQSGHYTAPLTAGTFHVFATSRAHPAASATAVVSVPSLSVALSPKTVMLLPDETQQFTALVAGSVDTRVSWAIVEGAAGGSIDRAGTYTAPATAGTYHVVAASIADPSSNDTALVTVADPPGVSVSIVPGTAAVQPGGSIRLSATV